MIIRRVALKNIKSYGEDIIEFQEGVTSIHGLNGAGKSTVLESIGYALFDSLPYNQEEFVRKGEKTGEVSVTIVGMDNLEYTVIRKCGSSPSYAIRDKNGVIIEGKDDVGSKLCEVLGYKVPDIGQLRSLFENAVGVLQGTFVSEFLESPSRRKTIFDPLLRIDEYNTAHRNLLQLKNYVKNSIDEMDKDIRYQEGMCKPRESLITEKETLAGYQLKLKQENAEKNELQLKAAKEKERYDAIEKALRDIESSQKVAMAEKRNKESEIKRIQAELKKSEDAKKNLEQNEASFKRYVSLTEEKESLEKQRAERDELLKKANAIHASVVEQKTKLADCERSLKEMEKFESEIKALEPRAAEQETLEVEIQGIQSDINTRDHELSRLKERMQPLKTVKGNMCPVLPNVECKSVTDFQGFFLAEVERIQGLKAELEKKLKDTSNKLKALNDPRLALNVKKEALKKQAQMKADEAKLQALLIEKESEQVKLLSSLSAFSELESRFRAINGELRSLKPAYDEYQQNVRIASLAAERQKELDTAKEALDKKVEELSAIGAALEAQRSGYDADTHTAAKAACEKLLGEIASIAARLESNGMRLSAIDRDLKAIEGFMKNIVALKEKRSVETDYLAFVERAREIIRMAGPEVIRVYIELISREATEMYCEIAGDRRFGIRWTPDYDILLIEDGRERTFRQLSGGEQMSAALAVRLAVLKILTSSDVVFLDEPTQNLDESRREHLAQEIMRIKDFRQMVIISHDDTFNASLENVIEIEKVNGESRVRRRNARPPATLS